MMPMEQKSLKEEDVNVKGWESIAEKWHKVKWPRRPAWKGEFEKLAPLFDSCRGNEVLILGATPEFRAWLGSRGARITLYEKSAASLEAMNNILKGSFGFFPKNEKLISADWEDEIKGIGKFSLIMGDIVLGYMQTMERMLAFLGKMKGLLAEDGKFVLRDFVYIPYVANSYGRMPVDLRRWAYIMTPGLAVQDGVFDEDMLAYNLGKMNDREALATCASPGRKRLMPDFKQLGDAFERAGLEQDIKIAPSTEWPRPALFVLSKN
ncbi:MAG: class I SAM-dependent methyltransferase [Candidatus Anstonellales archaeon]